MLITVCINCMAVPAFASNTTANSDIIAMNNRIYQVYLLIRNNVAFPLLALSFASCGFKILGASIIGSGGGMDKGIQAAKEQIITSVLALLFILVLPYLISYGIQLFRASAWKPAVILPIISTGGGIL